MPHYSGYRAGRETSGPRAFVIRAHATSAYAAISSDPSPWGDDLKGRRAAAGTGGAGPPAAVPNIAPLYGASS